MANPLPSALALTPQRRAQLRELLARSFDLEDLRTLAFDLGLNHEDISGDTVRARTRELIAFLEKRERLSELIAWARRERPTIDWVNLANPANAKSVEVSVPTPVKNETPPVRVASPKPVAEPLIIDLPKLNFRLELVRIPAGLFMMGSDQKDNEKPIHAVTLPNYWIGKYPVTNAQYAIFAKAVQRKFVLPKGKEAHPVVRASWRDAQEFCKWLSGESGRNVMLPSEAEFEKAARGPSTSSSDVRAYPWGNQAPDKTLCNFGNNEKGTTPVGKYSTKGDSPYGCADMAGNVWEWTRSKYEPYPYRAEDGREEDDDSARRVVRGGSWASTIGYARCAVRFRRHPVNGIDDNLGFRVVVVAAPVL